VSTKPIKFGTDGWRAIIGEEYTFENVRYCSQGVAEYFRQAGQLENGLVVGYDTRFASEHFAEAATEVLCGNSIKVLLADRACPTPVASYNLVQRKATGGVVITASHNPGTYSGYKVKPDYGGSASPEIVAKIEEHIARAQQTGQVKRMPLAEAEKKGLLQRFDPSGPYLKHMGTLVNLDEIRQAPLKIVVDSMYGAGAGYIAQLLKGGKAQVIEIHSERNPAFPGMAQPEPIAQNLRGLTAAVREHTADVGIATDGDADRLGLMDEHGTFITQLQTISLLALYLLEVQGKRAPIVKSITTSSMLFRLGELYKVPVFETSVGFKYIGPIMIRENAMLGGEESGGYGFAGHIPERDGILSGLYILSMMVKLKKKPSQLIDYLYSKTGPHHYDRIDITFDPARRESIMKRIAESSPTQLGGSKVAGIDTFDGRRFRLADGSWSLIRFSGTEPLLRIYCETSSPERVKQLLAETRGLTGA
jgi:phosphomannomutase